MVGDPVGEGAGLARAGAGEDEGGAGVGSDGGVLLVVQFGAEVDRGEIHGVVVLAGSIPWGGRGDEGR